MATSTLTLTRQRKNQADSTVVVKHEGKNIKSVLFQGKEILGKIGQGFIDELQDKISE